MEFICRKSGPAENEHPLFPPREGTSAYPKGLRSAPRPELSTVSPESAQIPFSEFLTQVPRRQSGEVLATSARPHTRGALGVATLGLTAQYTYSRLHRWLSKFREDNFR